MSHLIQQNQFIPRLAKNKQLENPYQSTTTSATSDLSRIFLLNDRRKVTFSQQSESEQQSPTRTLSQTLNRFLTVNRQSPIHMVEFQEYSDRQIGSTAKQKAVYGNWDECNKSTASNKQQYKQDNQIKHNITQTPQYQQYDPHSRSPTFNPRVYTSETPQFASQNKNGTPNQIKKCLDYEQQNKQYTSPLSYQQQPYQQNPYVFDSPDNHKNKTKISIGNSKQIQSQYETNQYKNSTLKQQIRVQSKYEQKLVYNAQVDRSSKQHNNPRQVKASQSKKPKIVVDAPPQYQISGYPNKIGQGVKQINKKQQQINQQINEKTEQQQQKKTKKQYDIQQIAEEEDMAELIKVQVGNLNMTKSISKSNKPSLYAASRVIEMGAELSGSKKKGSLIDKIKQQTFFQSRVILPNQRFPRQAINVDDRIQNHKTQRMGNNERRSLTPRRKYKIFGYLDNTSRNGESSLLTPTKYGQLAYKNPQHSQNRPIYDSIKNDRRYEYQQRMQRLQNLQHSKIMQQKSNQKLESRYKKQSENLNKNKHQRQNSPNFAICPHTQCILKSLQIIDKLTDQRHYGSRVRVDNDERQEQRKYLNKDNQKQYEKHKSVVSYLHQIQSESLDISLQIDKLIAGLTLQQLLDEETGRKIKQMKIQTQRLIEKIKLNNEQQNFIRFNQSNLSSRGFRKQEAVRFGISRLTQNKWDLCGELQKICRSLHYIQVVQERYKMWNLRLHHLSERVKDILRADKSNQIKKLHDLAQHISDLQESKFYGQEASQLGLVQAYNNYIEKQINQLKLTVEWIKNDILSR